MSVKGIILAGGSGTRLFPLTLAVSKQILPVYDKPIIYYPLAVLMMAGIREVLIISTYRDLPLYQRLLKTGEQLGMTFSYMIQDQPRGIAEALILGESFINDDGVTLVLGDNIFYGQELEGLIQRAIKEVKGATIFGYPTDNPSAFGIVEIDKTGKALSVEEKPDQPKSCYAVPGIYIYDDKVSQIAKAIKPSDRGELEITSVNEAYLNKEMLYVKILDQNIAWFDTGTHESLLEAGNYIKNIQKNNKIYIGCIEEIAYRKGFIDKEQLLELARPQANSDYGKHLIKIINNT